MNFVQTFRVAVRALFRNKLRSFLTALGIIIGVAAVIAMVAIGQGAKSQVEATYEAMGTNLLIVMPGSSNSGGARGGFGSQPTLTFDDLKAIQTQVPSVRAAAPVLRASAQIQSEDQNWTTSVQGTTPEYLEVRNWGIQAGVPLTQSDVDSASKNAVLGSTVAQQLFGSGQAVGQLVRIKGVPFQVVGVLTSKGQSNFGQDYDDVVLVPDTTYRQRIEPGLGNFLSGTIYVEAISGDATARAQKQIENLLRDRHRIPEGEADDFNIRNLAEMASARQQSTDTMTALLAAVAFVSLVVGGIGIMNIMLVSVTERTREIGVRMALGATPGQILLQFLSESLTLSVVGGILGIALGVLVGHFVAVKFQWPLLIQPEVAVVAVAFSAVVGVVFGLYPAWKASRLDPIEALRFE